MRLIMLLALTLTGCTGGSHAQEGAVPKLPFPVTRAPGPGPGWEAAYDLVLARNGRALGEMGVRALSLGPRLVDGVAVPHLIELRYPSADPARPISRPVLVMGGDLVRGQADPARLARLLAGQGFPARPLPAALVAELLCYFSGSLPDGWCPAPKASLDGATLVLEQSMMPSGGAGGAMGPIPHRLEVRFDAQARFTLRQLRQEDPGGPWTPAP